MNPAKPDKRGKWWVRLCIDLKHLRMRKECLKVAEHALLEQNWVKTGSKNALFRIKEQLAKGLSRKQNFKKKKTDEDMEEEKNEERKELEDLLKDIALT